MWALGPGVVEGPEKSYVHPALLVDEILGYEWFLYVYIKSIRINKI